MDKMLRLQNNIELDSFNRLLDLCFEVSTYFSFTENGVREYSRSKKHEDFIREFKPFLIQSKEITHWHYYYVPDYNKKTVYIYKADKEAKNIIEKNFDNLFLEERVNGKLISIKDLPEDLCFFIDNKLFLGTVSHEGICTVYPPTDEICEAILQLGEWEIVKYLDEEQIILDL